MDRFKFRVWDCEKKKYIDQKRVLINGHGFFYYRCDDNKLYNWTRDFIVEYCIGHKDKTKKLIYQGDLVLLKYSSGYFDQFEIVWNHSAWGFKSKGGFLYPLEDIGLYEIIGNIRENPDRHLKTLTLKS